MVTPLRGSVRVCHLGTKRKFVDVDSRPIGLSVSEMSKLNGRPVGRRRFHADDRLTSPRNVSLACRLQFSAWRGGKQPRTAVLRRLQGFRTTEQEPADALGILWHGRYVVP